VRGWDRSREIVTKAEQAFEAEDSRRSALGRVLSQQAAVAQMAQRALEGRDLGQLLNEACVLVQQVLESDLVDVLQLSEDGQTLHIVAGVGWRPGVVGHVTLPAQGGSQAGYTLASGGPTIAADFATETRFRISAVLADHDARSGIAVRLGSADDPFGVLASFASRPHAFNHDDAAFMQSVANVLGSAVARLRAEADLRRSRDEMTAIVTNVADGILVQRPDRGLVFVNDAAARLCGFQAAAELLATPWEQLMSAFELIDEAGRPMGEDRLPARIAMQTGRQTEPTPIRFRIRATGEERWSMVQAVPVLDAQGRVEQVVSVFRDVTAERRQLDDLGARRAELEAVISAMGEAVLLFDESGELRVSNRAATRLLGGPPNTIDQLTERLGATDLEGEHHLEQTGRWVEVSLYRPRRTGTGSAAPGSAVVVLRDVTDTRTAQVAREAFIGVLSHELRTPITTIYGGSELLERDIPADQRAEIVADIRAESERLARLVEDLLVTSRVERGGVEIGDEPVLIQRVLPGLVETMSARWPDLRIDSRVEPGLPAVRGDVTYLEQVLRNLLTNAIRYGDALNQGVQLSAEARDEHVVVRVLDDGPGLGTASPEQLFELFYRAPSARAVAGGAGIGLFVCRHLVEAMGGRMWARERDGGGTEFGFELPVIDAV
jgi:PAS domain S-box-containing protein